MRILVEPPLSFALLESLFPIRGCELEDAVIGPLGEQVEEISEVGVAFDD